MPILFSSFPRRRESSQLNIPRSGQNHCVIQIQLRWTYSIVWIPACAGMTV
jgi:hypothetical protein